jgi:hypothetical protein
MTAPGLTEGVVARLGAELVGATRGCGFGCGAWVRLWLG